MYCLTLTELLLLPFIYDELYGHVRCLFWFILYDVGMPNFMGVLRWEKGVDPNLPWVRHLRFAVAWTE